MKYYEYGKPVPLGTKEEKNKIYKPQSIVTKSAHSFHYHLLPFEATNIFHLLYSINKVFPKPLFTYKAHHGCWVIKLKNQSLTQRCSQYSAEDSKVKTNTAEGGVSHTTILSSSFEIHRKKFPNLPVVEGERHGNQATEKGRNYCQTCKVRTPDRANIMVESIETRENVAVSRAMDGWI